MSRFQVEWQRLYAPSRDAIAGELIDAHGQVRALVLALCCPADWPLVARVWQGVQVDLGWPAPAIAVSGMEAYQLWFSLAQAVPVDQAQAVLQALCARYLPDVQASRLSLLPMVDAAAPSGLKHADPVPACMPGTECWSAFVAPDLAPVFADTPWLDIPPGMDGQAELLSRHRSIALADLAHASPRPQPAPLSPASVPAPAIAGGVQTDPRQFLLDVMNNPALDWSLRIEAAKALLP